MADAPKTPNRTRLWQIVAVAGIVGLGGAAFPTSPKLTRGKARTADPRSPRSGAGAIVRRQMQDLFGHRLCI